MPRAAPLLASVLAAGLLLAVGSCSSDDEPDPFDGSTSSGFLPEAAPPRPDAQVPPGMPCGNASGLQSGSPWPLRGGCPKRAGYGELTGPANARTAWSLSIPMGESSPAVAANGVVWVGTTGGDVLGVVSGGVVRAHHGTNDAGADASVRSSAAMATTGAAVIAGADGILYGVEPGPDVDAAFPPATIRFQIAIGPMASSPAIAADGTIYVATLDGRLVAVARGGGSIAWTATTNDTLGSSPAIGGDGTVYAGSSDRKLYAFRPDGTPKWSVDLGASVTGVAVGGEDTVYAGTSDGKLVAAAPADGATRWTYQAGGAITGGPSVYAGRVFVGSADKKLHAVSTPDGQGIFAFATLGAVATPVIASNGTVYVGSADGKLYAILPSGLLFFAASAQGPVRGAPAFGTGGMLYVTTDNGIVAIGP